jgi:hypothetical protein
MTFKLAEEYQPSQGRASMTKERQEETRANEEK